MDRRFPELLQTAFLDPTVTAKFYEANAFLRNPDTRATAANALYRMQEDHAFTMNPECDPRRLGEVSLDDMWPEVQFGDMDLDHETGM